MIVLTEREYHNCAIKGLVGGLLIALAIYISALLLKPEPVAPPSDPRMDKLCHWPSAPGEALIAFVDETGKRRCFELGRHQK